jgi:uncharacterized SAM-binding protein YcdF (DUF218 family)
MDILFFAKKMITFFIEPLGLILTLSLVGLYFLNKSNDKKAKFFLGSSVFLLLFLSYPPIGNGLIQQLENQYPKYSDNRAVKYIHILGGGHHDNDDWPLSAQIGNASLKRTIEGVSIYKKLSNPDIKLIFTGYAGSNNNTSNSEINAAIARLSGIENRSMVVNSKPKDTADEAIFAQSIIGNNAFILVTSASHMPRAVKLFKKLDMNPIPAPTDFHSKNKPLLSAPTIDSLQKSRIAIHEFLGIAWSYLAT